MRVPQLLVGYICYLIYYHQLLLLVVAWLPVVHTQSVLTSCTPVILGVITARAFVHRSGVGICMCALRSSFLKSSLRRQSAARTVILTVCDNVWHCVLKFPCRLAALLRLALLLLFGWSHAASSCVCVYVCDSLSLFNNFLYTVESGTIMRSCLRCRCPACSKKKKRILYA